MNAMTSVAPSARAQVLILTARYDCGQRNRVSEGAVALAEFLAEHQDDDAGCGLIHFVGGWNSVQRMLADDIMPGNEWGEEMGRLSGGALTPGLWRRPYIGELDPVDPAAWDEAARLIRKAATTVIVDDPADTSSPATPTSSGILCEVMGRPGEVESGPLYAAVFDPITPNAFVVTGFGRAERFDAPAARAFRAALADGLAKIGASA